MLNICVETEEMKKDNNIKVEDTRIEILEEVRVIKIMNLIFITLL